MIRVAALAIVLAASGSARAESHDRWDGGTVAEQAGGGLITGALFGAAGGVVGGLFGSALGGKGNWGAPLAGGLLGVVVGGGIGVIWAVDYFGDNRGLDGSGLATTLGEVGGILSISLIEAGFEKGHWKVPAPVHIALATVFVIGGPIVGYQLSSSAHGSAKRTVPIIGFVF